MKIGSIVFATGNKNKLEEARKILGIGVKGTSLEIDEIQSLDPIKVATEKVKAYYKQVKAPIFVEDVSLSIKELGGLPGTYISDFLIKLDNEGIINLLKNKKNREAVALTTIVYKENNKTEHVFQGEMKGTISNKAMGENGFGWDKIFIPNGETKTLAQMSLEEKNKYSMRAKALKAFSDWLTSHK